MSSTTEGPAEIDYSGPQEWHTVTTDSPTIYTWRDTKFGTGEEQARAFAREIGMAADYHRAGSEMCKAWGCTEWLEAARG